jgi:AraC-like DNA-binding protein
MRTVFVKEVLKHIGGNEVAYQRFPLLVSRSILKNGVTPHFHDFFEIDAVVKGKGTNRLGDQRASFQNGDLLLGSPLEEHALEFKNCHIISLKFGALASGPEAKEQVRHLEPFLNSDPSFRLKVRLLPEEQQAVFGILKYLLTQTGTKGSEHGFYTILSILRQAYDRLPRRATHSDLSPPALPLKVMAYIDEHFPEELRVEDLAKLFEISPSRLNVVFRRTLGQAVKSYLTARRIAFAKHCLARGAGVGETAALSGFNDVSVFFRAFTKTVGVSPKVYSSKT